MYVSTQIRDAIYRNAAYGFAFLHAPKTAGTATRRALRAKHPVLRLKDVELGPLPPREALFRHRVEKAFLRSLRPGRPWFLDLGHGSLTLEEANDIPEAMPILITLRHSKSRIMSWFRFDCMMAEAIRSSVAVMTMRHSLVFTPVSRHRRGTLPMISTNPTHLATLSAYRGFEARYLFEDGYGLNWQRWITDRFDNPSQHPFLYRDLLPGLENSDDPRLKRLVPLDITQVSSWVEENLHCNMRSSNVSPTYSDLYGLEQALEELAPVAENLAGNDATPWALLRQKQVDCSQ